MPEFLERKLRAEYGNDNHAIYGTMNALGAMHGNRETAKGKAMQAKHDLKMSHLGQVAAAGKTRAKKGKKSRS